MANKNTTSKRKSSTSTRKKTTSARKRKPKVYVSPYKALALCGAVILFCLCLLLLVSKLDSPKQDDESSLPTITQRFEDQTTPVSSSTNTTTKEPEKKQEVTKKDTSLSSVPSVPKKETQKKEDTVIVRTEEPSIQDKTELQKNTTETQTPVQNTTQKTETKPVSSVPVAKPKSYDFPQAVNHAQLIFVFDDGGQNLNHLDAFLTLPFPISIAVLPRLTYSKESAKRIRASGNELMLHQPMQAINASVNPGPGAITPDMTEDQIISTLFTNINEIGPIAGINNHEGSAITADADKMAVVLKTTSENGIFFLDSRTNVETKVPYVAGEMGYGYYERNIFLDNTKTKENALSELKKGLTIANKNGSVIMIGHIWSADFLPAFLKEVYPELKEKGYTFSVVSKSNAIKY